MRLTSWLSAVRSFGYRTRPQGQYQKRVVRRNLDWLERLEDRTLMTVNLTVDTNTASEAGATVVTVTATNSSNVITTQTVQLSVTGTGITGSDYSLSSTTITIFAGTNSGTATFTILNDNLVEGSESATISMFGPTGGELVLDGINSQVVGITDDDSVALAFTSGTSNTTEAGAPTLNVPVGLTFTTNGSGPVQLANSVSVNVTHSGGTATDGVDHTMIGTQTLTFGAGSTSATTQNASFTVTNDQSVEGSETVILAVAINTSNVGAQASIGGTNSNTATITDNDSVALAFTSGTSSTTEVGAPTLNVPVGLTFTTDGTGAVQLDRSVSVNVTRSGGTATDGTDHSTIGTQTLTFAAGSTSATTQNASFTVTNDRLLEGSETVILAVVINTSNVGAQASIGGTNSNTATITDDESATLAIATTSTVTEQGGAQSTGAVTLTITGTGTAGTFTLGSGITLTANVTEVGGGTATGGGTDYAAIGTQTITFNGGDTTGTVRSATITPANDILVEGSETVNLNLSTLVAPATVTASLGTTSNTTTITDNDFAVISFTTPSVNVSEGGTSTTFNITLTITANGVANSGTLDRAVTFQVSNTNTGTATTVGPPIDYTFSTQSYSYPIGTVSNSTQTVTVGINEDITTELGETVILQFSSMSDGTGGQVTTSGNQTVTILDNDAGTDPVFNAPTNNGTDAFQVVRSGTDVLFYRNTVLIDTRSFGSMTSLTIQGANAETDTLDVDLTLGNVIPANGINFYGGSGANNDAMTITGGAQGDVTYNYTNAHDGSVVMSLFGTVNYTGLEPIANTGTAANAIFNLPAGGNTAFLQADGAGLRLLSSPTSLEVTTFTLPTESLTINGGAGVDNLTIDNVNGGVFALSVLFGAGSDLITQDASMTLGSGASTGNVNYTAGTITVNQQITNTAGTVGTVTMNASNTLTIAAAGNISANSTVSLTGTTLISTAGDITTTNDAVTFNSNTKLTDDISINTGAGAGTITFSGTLNGTTAGAEDLSLTAGTGSVVFTGAVGSGVALHDITIASATNVTFTSTVETTGNVTQTAGTGLTTFNGTSGTGIGGTLSITTDGSILFSTATVTTVGTVNLDADNAITVDAGIDSGASTITILANQNPGGDESFTMGGTGALTTTNNTSAAVSITVNTGAAGSGDASIRGITTGASGRVTITTNRGDITDNNGAATNITALEALLLAALAGGAVATSGDSLETAVTRLEAQANTGGVFVDNTSASLTIGGVSGSVTGVSATGSDIVVTTSGGVLIVSENVTNTSGTGTDDVTLTAKDSAGAGHNLTVNASTTVSSAAGDVTLDAGDVLTLTASTSVVQATGTNGDVNLISDVTAADTIGSQVLDGTITANGTNGIVTINLGTGTGDAVQAAGGTVTGNALRLLSSTNGGRFNLSASTTNNVNNFAANSSGTITYVNQDDLTITTVSTTVGLSTSDDDVRLVVTAGNFSILQTINLNNGGPGGAGGSLDLVATTGATQDPAANILAKDLLLRGSNATLNTNVFNFPNAANNVDTIGADLTNGAVTYYDTDGLTVGTPSVTTLGAVPNSSAIGITVGNSGNVAPNGGDVILRAGRVTLTGLLVVTEIIDTTTGTLGNLTIGNGVQFIGSGNTDVGSGDIDLEGGSDVPDIIIDNATTHTMTGGTVTYRPDRDIFINQPVTVENGNFILDADGETLLVNTTIAQTTSMLDVNRNLGTGNGVGGVWIRSAGSVDVNFGALSAGALIIAGSQINNAPAYGGLVGGAGVQIDSANVASASSTISVLVKTITGLGSALNDMQIDGQIVGEFGSAINVQVEDTLTLTGTIALSLEGNITIDAEDMVIDTLAVIDAVETGASTATGIVWLRNRTANREIDVGGAALPAMPGGRLSLTNDELNTIAPAQVVRIGRNGNSGLNLAAGAGLMTISVPDLDLSQNTVLHLITSDEIVDGGAGGINGLGTIIEDDVALEADDGIDLHNFDATATTGNDVDHLAILVTGGDAVFKDRDEVIFQIVDNTATVAVDAVQVSGDLTMIMGGDLTQTNAVNVGGLELIDLFNGAATNPQAFLESPFYFLPHSSNQIDNLEAYSLNQVNVTNSTTLSVNTVANSYLTFPVGGSSGIWVQRLLLKAPTIITLLPIETNDEIGTVTFDVTTLLDINANIFARSTIEQIGTGAVTIADVELRTTDDNISFLGGVTLDGASLTVPTTISTDAGWANTFTGITLATGAPAQTGGGSIIFYSYLRSSPSGDTASAYRGNDLWLETGSGNIQFNGQVGGAGTHPANALLVTGRVGVINIVDAHDVTASTGLSANAFYQQTGDGETRFNGLVQTNGRANFVATTPVAAGNYGVDITTKMITLNAGMTTTQGVAGVAAAIRLNNSGTLSIVAGTGSISSQGAVTQVGTGDNLVGGNIITSNDDISFASDTYLSGTPLQFTAGTANVSFVKRFQINNKTITIREEGTLNVGTVTAFAGGTLNVITDSTGLAGTLEIGLNELLTGAGTINAAVTVLGSAVNGAGTIAPAQDASGLGTGILTINGATSFGQNAVLAADLNGTVAGSSYDQLKVNGALALGASAIFAGTRPVTFNPALNTALTVIDATSLTGKFVNATAVAPSNFLYINGLYFSYVYNGTGDFVLTRQDAATPVSYIIDDNGNSTGTLPTGFSISPNTTAAWSPNSVAGRGYGNDLRFSAASTNTATWTFTGLAAGTYRVSTTWFPHANRADNASFTINGGTAVALNQRNAPNDFKSDGSAWEDISTSFTLAAPGSITVQLSAVGATGYVIADAVRVQPLTTSAPEIQVFDYTASTFVDVADGTGVIDFGTVDQGAGGGSISKPIRVYNTGSSALLLSSASITVPAGFSVTGYNPQTIAAATSATLALNTSFITLTLTLNTTTAANYNGQVSFNTNDFDENPFNFTVKAGVSSANVKIADNLSAGSGYNTITGAANNAGTNRMYGEVGPWHNNDDSLVGYQQDLRYANANSNSQATWTFSSLPIGTYRVSVTYRAESNRASNTSFSVAGTGATTVNTTINQRVAPNQFQDTNIYWIDLANTFAISGGSITVTLNALGSNGFVIADAVRIEYLSAAYPELAAAGPAANPTSTVLNAADLDATAAAAVARWQQAGLTAAQQSALNGIVFTIADLPGAMLGGETESTIFVDANAAGYGWYVDPTPADDAEFGLTIASTELGATDPVAATQMDLLTVLMHEIGHRLGLDDVALIDNAHGLMAESLNVGIRRLPVVAVVSEGDVEVDDSGDGSTGVTDDVSDQLFYTLGAEDDSTPATPILAVNGVSGSSDKKNRGAGHSTGENQSAHRHNSQHRKGGKPHDVPAGNRSLLGALLNLVRNRRK